MRLVQPLKHLPDLPQGSTGTVEAAWTRQNVAVRWDHDGKLRPVHRRRLAQLSSEDPPKPRPVFKPGRRVVLAPSAAAQRPELAGWAGTVVEVFGGARRAMVSWDTGRMFAVGVESLEAETAKPAVPPELRAALLPFLGAAAVGLEVERAVRAAPTNPSEFAHIYAAHHAAQSRVSWADWKRLAEVLARLEPPL